MACGRTSEERKRSTLRSPARGGSAEATTVELVEKFINLGDDRNVRVVWVRGREVFRSAV